MSTQSNKLEYIHKFFSFAQMSEQSGIPSSTLSAVARGERKLPEMYRSDLRNMYQRTAYHDMREQGLSPDQARRFSWYSSTRVKEVVQEIGSVVSRIADSRIESFIESQKRRGTYSGDNEARAELEDAIQDAISRSDLPEERLQAIEYSNTKDL